MKSENHRQWSATARTAIALGAWLLAAVAGTGVQAQEFKGYTLKVKLIGGTQYEPLYAIIPEWEKKTGARVEILSRKNHFELDKEIKQDIAARKIDYCVASNHTSFSPQYGDIYRDLQKALPATWVSQFGKLVLEHSTVAGSLVLLPRHSDVSELYYNKKFYDNTENKAAYKTRFGKELLVPDTWTEFARQAKFFSKPPSVYGTQFPGKDEAITGRFYEMLVAEGGALFDKDWRPTFNSAVGERALNFFVDLYKSGAVPKGVPNYIWDDLGQGFASGNIALNLDWGGWAGFFNDPKNSRIAGNVGIARAPRGSSGKRTGWAGSHGFSITKACDNPKAAASLVMALTSLEAQMIEARNGMMPTRMDAQKQAAGEFAKKGDKYMLEVFQTFAKGMAEDAFTPPLIPEWIEASNAIWPELQKALIGEKTGKQALDDAANKVLAIMQDAGRVR
ncbi:extracellular solute-binding protein [Verminephrobacter eiseniae]|uniref:Extracellular solute-binding protein, family 1 n=1 Tax=Verminephrobacter eiseniae (strain EF01-2) TaxID=391735 RepID=A1WK69_VEREI|nr:extracellular solute-binding protein [Verminephrobacter eiseniae]ABM58026.1 extracellular solute-binding protein, family 1 [Verminephrobacter eiseniae EF01-2]